MAGQYLSQAAALDTQAQFTRYKAKQDSLKHKKEANDHLTKILMTMASINAAAGAGNMDPFTGNAFGLKVRALNVGGTNFAMAKGNEDIVRLMGYEQAKLQNYQAGLARKAAGSAYKRGVMGAFMSLGMGAYNYMNTAVPTSTFQGFTNNEWIGFSQPKPKTSFGLGQLFGLNR